MGTPTPSRGEIGFPPFKGIFFTTVLLTINTLNTSRHCSFGEVLSLGRKDRAPNLVLKLMEEMLMFITFFNYSVLHSGSVSFKLTDFQSYN